MVARDVAGRSKVVSGCDLEPNIAEPLADRLGGLREPAHVACATASVQVIGGHVRRHPSESPLIVQRPGQDFGFPEIPFDPLEFCEGNEGVSQIESDIDGLLQRLAGLGKMGQRR